MKYVTSTIITVRADVIGVFIDSREVAVEMSAKSAAQLSKKASSTTRKATFFLWYLEIR